MELFILKVLKKLKDEWEKWDLRSFILLSLFLQIFINLFAPLRKWTTTAWVTALLWLAYLLSDWAANYAVGLISSSQKDGDKNSDLLAFWAPFLMVHLGGPDTITAYAVEDNKLWLRHLFSLIFQSLSAIYVFIQSLPENQLVIPNVLMFISGLYKYTERLISLYNARTDSETVPDYAKLMEELDSKMKANIPVQVQKIAVKNTRRTDAVERKLTDTDVVLYAYKFFKSLKDFTADLIVGVDERDSFRDFFLKRKPEDAFGVIEVELNFIYEVLFTKVGVVYSKYGYCIRITSFALVVASFLLFYFNEKQGFQPPDVAITYTLLIGAIMLDATAFIRIFTSDWFKAQTTKLPGSTDFTNNKSSKCFFAKILYLLQSVRDFFAKFTRFHGLRQPVWGFFAKILRLLQPLRGFFAKILLLRLLQPVRGFFDTVHNFLQPVWGFFPKILLLRWLQRVWRFFDEILYLHVLRRRWSKNVAAYSLIACSLNPRDVEMEKFIDMLDLTYLVDSAQNVKGSPFTTDLRDHIFQELWKKSDMADDLDTAKEITAARGGWILRYIDCNDLLPYVAMDFDESLLIWHIATEICYYGVEETTNTLKSVSKILSDYMVYLLIKQPAMMSAVSSIGQIRFRDTVAEAKLFHSGDESKQPVPNTCGVIIYVLKRFVRRLLSSPYNLLCLIVEFCGRIFMAPVRWWNGKPLWENKDQDGMMEGEKKFCEKILGVKTLVDPPGVVKGDESKSVLFDGCILAKKMIGMDGTKGMEYKWEVLSKVWVEMLCYAAMRCSPNTHAIQLSKGGELVTLVWLLMVHFGFGNQFMENEDHFRASVVWGK